MLFPRSVGIDDGRGVLHKVVNEHRPSPIVVVVGKVVFDDLGKVEQQVPSVAGDGAPVVLLRGKTVQSTAEKFLNQPPKTVKSTTDTHTCTC